jgi:hypothetical protein
LFFDLKRGEFPEWDAMKRSRLVDWTAGLVMHQQFTGVRFPVCLSGLLALLTAVGVALYPGVFHEGIPWMIRLFVAVAWAGATSLLIGYGCKYFDSVLEYAVSGGDRHIEVPSRNPGPACTSFLRWMLCFVSGPAALISLALRYWMYCGSVAGLEGLILAGLTAPAIGYWLMQLLVLAERPELTRATPMQVLEASRRLGHRTLLAGSGVTLAAFGYIAVGAYAIILLHSAWLAGLALLWLCWYSAWECGALALRIVGFWFYESRRSSAKQPNT